MKSQNHVWICTGVEKDGTPSLPGRHFPINVEGRFCPECGLDREKVIGAATDPKKMDYLALGVGGLSLLGVLLIGGIYLKWHAERAIFKKPVVLGILNDPTSNPPEKYADFVDYLKTELPKEAGVSVEIKQDFVPLENLSSAKEKLKKHEWDIALTTSPVLAVEAKNNGFLYAFRMFPDMLDFQAALFVRKDSPIRSIDDIRPTTTIALGIPNSVPSFRIPLYDLFGISFKPDLDNSLQVIIEKVMKGEVEVGTGIYSALSQQSDKLRIIAQSRKLPLSGVYLSPDLSEEERKIIQTVLAAASSKLQEDAQYAKGNEPDYTEFSKIEARVIELENCVNWSNAPAIWTACLGGTYTPPTSIPGAVKGTINGYELHHQEIYLLLSGENGKNYRVILPIAIMEKELFISDLYSLRNKQVQITPDVPEVKVGHLTELKISRIGQLQPL